MKALTVARATAIAVLVIFIAWAAPRALRRQAEFVAVLRLLLLTVALSTQANQDAKLNTATRNAALAAANAASAQSVAGTAYSTANTTDGRVNGLSNANTSTDGLANGTIGGSTGQINTGGGTAHTHGPGTLAVNSGLHDHQLPSV
jgi:hypothetical protein